MISSLVPGRLCVSQASALLASRPLLCPPSNLPSLGIYRTYSDEASEDDRSVYAYNDVERKKGLLKPVHTIEEQIEYMKSRVYEEAYKGVPVYKWYKRNVRGQLITQSKPRLICIDAKGKFRLNNACPICRDEYLFFDYRNPALIEQFLAPGTDMPIHLIKSGLCREQYNQLQAQLLKAQEHGTLTFDVPFRNFDYKEWYANYEGEKHQPVDRGSNKLWEIHPDPLVGFPTFKRDFGNNWDQWWLRQDEFARKAK
ncbi:hypothetical protein L596_015034 [Steinernema carpocapsae]|uniref:28S ribosomal protein S18b, mitochondrial n=1 Tax=Steinernema carpocapsae TaxID=34508 RepID=A0A4U5NDZ6_STECR|nr:hypothetical protein L596_015034 [Steinernema carpocapsae]